MQRRLITALIAGSRALAGIAVFGRERGAPIPRRRTRRSSTRSTCSNNFLGNDWRQQMERASCEGLRLEGAAGGSP